MLLLKNKIHALFVIAILSVICAANFYENHPKKLDRAIQEGINFYKMGDYHLAMPILESHIDDPSARKVVGSMYALGLTGVEKREYASTLVKCHSSEACTPGEYEYGISVDVCRKNSKVINREDSSIYWRTKAFEMGYSGETKTCSEYANEP